MIIHYPHFLLVLCISFGLCGSHIEGRKYLRHHSSLHLPPPEVAESVTLPPKRWFIQFLNHFDPTENRRWKQKYYINDEFYEPGGPIFLLIGGEGPASPNWMVNGSWIDYARTFKAFTVQLEHRYYGESHPTSDASVKNLRYLTSEQALADLAFFVSKIKEERNLTQSKLIAFGGSYPGSLSVWFRLKYPHLVHASVSSSAPLVAQMNFKEYLDVVTASIITKGDRNCIQQINKTSQQMSLLLLHKVGWKTLEQMFSLCHPLDGSNEDDVSNLFENVAELFEDVVQYNEDNREFEHVKGTNVTITTICGIMNNNSLGNALQRTAALNQLHLKISEEKCLDHKYKSMIKELQKISWNSNAVGGRSWTYQTCTEFGFFQTSESLHQPFGNHFPLTFFLQQCSDIFGKNFSPNLLMKGIRRTNIIYGGKNPKVTRVVLINGSIDPWHYLSVTNDLNSDTPAIFINGTAHCANMYPSDPTDPPELVKARKDVEKLIARWLLEH